MNQELLCRWLNLPGTAWPPDPYALLGLTPGDTDLSRIEHQVHERLKRLRCYQITHPDEATEGMNRLAQAFVCLTEINMSSPAQAPTVVEPTRKARSLDDTLIAKKTVVNWQASPPPIRNASNTEVVAENDTEIISAPTVPPATVVVVPAKPAGIDAKQAAELVEQMSESGFGLGTLEAVIERVYLNRKVIQAWDKLGKFFKDASRKLKASEESEILKRLQRIVDLTRDFPGIVGQPGKPGYWVAVRARLGMTPMMFRSMESTQRECLARDWADARQVLFAYRKFLHRLFKKMRRQGKVRLMVRAVRGFINDHAAAMAAVCLALAALGGLAVFQLLR